MKTAIFDFDRTLTRHDTFRLYLYDSLRAAPWRVLPLALGLPLFLWTLLSRADKRWAKSWILWSASCGLSAVGAFESMRRSGKTHAAAQLLPEGTARIRALQESGVRVIVCTASAPEWVGAYLESAGLGNIDIVGSGVAYRLGGLIMSSANCYGAVKVKRLRPHLANAEVTETYSDHPSDSPLLNLGQTAYLISPKRHHSRAFRENLKVPHEILDWNNQAQISTPART